MELFQLEALARKINNDVKEDWNNHSKHISALENARTDEILSDKPVLKEMIEGGYLAYSSVKNYYKSKGDAVLNAIPKRREHPANNYNKILEELKLESINGFFAINIPDNYLMNNGVNIIEKLFKKYNTK